MIDEILENPPPVLKEHERKRRQTLIDDYMQTSYAFKKLQLQLAVANKRVVLYESGIVGMKRNKKDILKQL